MTPLEEDLKILERGVTGYLDEYKEQYEIWKLVETKAQILIALAGVFLGAVFSFVRQGGTSRVVEILVGVTLLLLFATLIVALRVLQTTETMMPVDGADLVRQCRDLVESAASSGSPGDRYKKLLVELGEDSTVVLQSIDSVNDLKRFHLNCAYWLLLGAASAAVAAALVQISISNH